MRLAATIALAGLLACAAPAAGQATLSDQTLSRPSAGLTASIPVGATMSSYQIAGRGATSVTLPGLAAIVNVTDVSLTKAQTLREVADSIIAQRLGSVSSLKVDPDLPDEAKLDPSKARGRLLERATKTIGGWPCELFYLQVASLGDEDSAFGYALFMPSGNSVAMFELQTTAPLLEHAKPYFELMVDSVSIADPALEETRRAVGVEAGIAFFQSLATADYEAVFERQGDAWRFERFYTPGADGSDREASELGYRRTRFVRGVRGDLKLDENRGRASAEDRQKGYLIFQEARILDVDRDMIIDVAASFFMSPDRQHEAWSIRQAVKPWRRQGPTSSSVETGIRERDDLTIARSENGKPFTTIQPAIEGAGYISRAETYLLPHLLIEKRAPGEYRCYAFNQQVDRVTLREDVLSEDPDHPGAWRYTSRPSAESPAQAAYYSAKGELVRAELPGEQIWEPISLERLVELWNSKGLPTD
ncbi:MAG TPA: hypothetical protein VFF69_02275 [Phycisphaerales bacterium]|nr:hypothetical protein [Phycisphaerales bacterium]